MRKQLIGIAVVGALVASAMPATASAALTTTQKRAIQKVGAGAWTYGYAPVYMKRNMDRFPSDRLLHVQYLATDLTRTVVKPNADTLYSIMVVSVGTDPLIVHIPSTGSRYFSLEFLDGHSNVFGYVGTRATGTSGGDYAIVGPNWNATATPLKRHVDGVIRSGTPAVWVVGRTLVDSQADVPAAIAVQNAINAQYNSKVEGNEFLPTTALTKPGDSAPTALEMKPGSSFFKEFGTVMAAQPPAPADAPMIASIAKYGIGPGLDPNKTQSSAVMAELVKGAKTAETRIKAGLDSAARASISKRNGWVLFDHVGDYGTDYLTRAIIAEVGVGANRPEESIYPGTSHTSSGSLMNCASGRVYKVHFNPGQAPPVDGFWSITMYADDQFFIKNPINRFAIGDRTPGLTYNSDGSLDVWISKSQPSAARNGAKNWLPAPASTFTIVMRAYIPRSSILNGTWVYPKVSKVT